MFVRLRCKTRFNFKNIFLTLKLIGLNILFIIKLFQLTFVWFKLEWENKSWSLKYWNIVLPGKKTNRYELNSNSYRLIFHSIIWQFILPKHVVVGWKILNSPIRIIIIKTNNNSNVQCSNMIANDLYCELLLKARPNKAKVKY